MLKKLALAICIAAPALAHAVTLFPVGTVFHGKVITGLEGMVGSPSNPVPFLVRVTSAEDGENTFTNKLSCVLSLSAAEDGNAVAARLYGRLNRIECAFPYSKGTVVAEGYLATGGVLGLVPKFVHTQGQGGSQILVPSVEAGSPVDVVLTKSVIVDGD